MDHLQGEGESRGDSPQQRPGELTDDEIRAECAAIQETWSERERATRIVDDHLRPRDWQPPIGREVK